MKPVTNENGLTFSEWLNAAGWRTGAVKPSAIGSLSAAHGAWKAGEDPTDYRAQGTFTKGAKS